MIVDMTMTKDVLYGQSRLCLCVGQFGKYEAVEIYFFTGMR